MTVVTIVYAITALVAGAITTALYQKATNASCKSKKRLEGKTVIVTGGTTGIGLEIATDLARRGAKVIVACPFEKEGIDAKRIIIRATDNQNVTYKHLDLASLNSVREFASDILKTEDRLDILINNAGVLMPDDVLTRDGLGFVMQVNYFGTFLLTILLLPLLKKTGTSMEASRIVNLSSISHNFGTVNLDKMNNVGYWFKWRIYCNSKLCVTLFTRELSKRLGPKSNVVVHSVDPGAVGTRIFDTCGTFLGFIIRMLFGALFKTAREGAQTAIHVALDDEVGTLNGAHFKNCRLSKAIYTAYDDKLCKKLWEESMRLVKLNYATI